MLSHCLKSKNDTESINQKDLKPSDERIMLSSKCAVRNSKKLRFIEKQEASKLLSKLGIKNFE